MRTTHRIVLVMSTIIAGACARTRTVAPVPTPVAEREKHCWWAVLRTKSPVDTVVARYSDAYRTLGLAPSAVSQLGDTAWVSADSAPMTAATFGARVVAYRVGDSTHFRTYLRGLADSTGRTISLCQLIAQTAGVHTVVPREPDSEAQSAVWRRRP